MQKIYLNCIKKTIIYSKDLETVYQTSRKNFKNTKSVNLKHICQKELDRTCFALDSAYSNIKYLAKRTIWGKAGEFARNSKYDGH